MALTPEKIKRADAIMAKYRKGGATGTDSRRPTQEEIASRIGFERPKEVGIKDSLLSAAQAPADIVSGIGNLVPGLQQQFGDPNKPFRFPIKENPEGLPYALGSLITPFGAGFKLAGMIPKVGKYAKSAHEGAKGLANKLLPSAERPGLAGTMGREALQGAGRGAAASAAIGETLRSPGTEQYENLGFNTGLGALLGGSLGGIGGIIPGAANRTVRTSERAYKETPNLIRPPEEVAAISKEVPSNLRINLGEYTKQPDTKAFYTDVLGNAPFSPVKGNERKALSAATEKSNAFINDLLGGTHPAEVSNTVSRSIKQKGEANKAEASKYYTQAFKQADKAGIKISETPKLDEGLKEILKNHSKGWLQTFGDADLKTLNRLAGGLTPAEERAVKRQVQKYKDAPSIELEKELNKHKGIGTDAFKAIEKELKKDLKYRTPTDESVKIYENSVRKKYGRQPISLEEAKNLRSSLLKESRSAMEGKEPNRQKASALGDAAKLLDSEIADAIKKSGVKSIQTNWDKANRTYREEFTPYGNTKEFKPVYEGKENVDPRQLLESAKFYNAKPSNSFAKVYSDLSAKDKNLVAYALLSKAAAEKSGKATTSPSALTKKASSLSPEMRAKAFTPEQLAKLKSQEALAKITKSGEKSAKVKNAQTLHKLRPDTIYGDFKKYLLGAINSPIASTSSKIMTSPAVRKAYETGKPLSYEKLMKEFNILNKGKHLSTAIQRTAYQFGKEK